jgi:ATP synthase protein I
MSEDDSGANGSFESRLRAARSRQGLDPVPEAETVRPSGADSSAFSAGTRAVVELVSAVVVAVVIGIALDRWLHTSPAFLVIFLALGMAAGVRHVWRLLAVPPE